MRTHPCELVAGGKADAGLGARHNTDLWRAYRERTRNHNAHIQRNVGITTYTRSGNTGIATITCSRNVEITTHTCSGNALVQVACAACNACGCHAPAWLWNNQDHRIRAAKLTPQAMLSHFVVFEGSASDTQSGGAQWGMTCMPPVPKR
eukprot:356194-Chlamydomonas_euryale.AAC.3